MRYKFKHIALRVFALLMLLGLLNFIYSKTLWFADVDEHSDTLENLWPHQDNSDIIYFGESSNFYQEHPDTPKVRISDFLDKMLPKLVIEEVDNAGLYASNYLHLMRHIPKHSKVKAVIVTMNLRSFGPTWIYNKNTNYLKKADELIKPRPKLFNRFMVGLKAFNYIDINELENLKNKAWGIPLEFNFNLSYNSLYEWNKAIGNGGILRDDGTWDMGKIQLASHYIKNFAFNIDLESNPRINDLDAIVEYAKTRGWKLYFHLLSENIMEAEELLGKELPKIIEWNANILLERYHKPYDEILVVNNLRTVPNSEFRDRTFPTEHYNNNGKRLCAKKLAKVIEGDINYFSK